MDEVSEHSDSVASDRRIKHASMFKEARLVASYCTDSGKRQILRDRIDECQADYDVFSVCPSQVAMETLVGSWTRMLIAVAAVGPGGGDGVLGGRLTAPPVAPALDLKRFTA